MAKQKETARAAGKFGGGTVLPAELVAKLAPTRFLGRGIRDRRPTHGRATGRAAEPGRRPRSGHFTRRTGSPVIVALQVVASVRSVPVGNATCTWNQHPDNVEKPHW